MRASTLNLLSSLPPLLAAAGMGYLFMSCCGNDSPQPQNPPTATPPATTEGMPPGTQMIQGPIEPGTTIEVGDLEITFEEGLEPHEFIFIEPEQHIQNKQLTPILASSLVIQSQINGSQGGAGDTQVGTTPKQDKVRLLPSPYPSDDDHAWFSGMLMLGQLSASEIASIDAGGEPVRFFFAFPFSSQNVFDSKDLETFFIQVFDGNGDPLPDSVYDGTQLVSTNELPSKAPFPRSLDTATIVVEWLNDDGTPVTPGQLGMDQGARGFRIGMVATELHTEYDFCYGMGLWEWQDRQGNQDGYGVWAGWHAGNWSEDYQDSIYPVISAIQDMGGNRLTAVAPGQVIEIVVENGYDLPYVAVMLGMRMGAILNATPGPGADEMTYTVQVARDAESGSSLLYFKNHGATPAWAPAEVGTRAPGFASQAVTVL